MYVYSFVFSLPVSAARKQGRVGLALGGLRGIYMPLQACIGLWALALGRPTCLATFCIVSLRIAICVLQ